MKNLGDAVDSFVLTHNRQPGALSERQLASDSNNYLRLSGTENALLELMGGLTPHGSDRFDLAGLKIYRDDIGMGPTINGAKYDSYFKPNPRDLYYVKGQLGQTDVENNLPLDDGVVALPDLIDSFGAPIIFWANSGSKAKGLREIGGRYGYAVTMAASLVDGYAGYIHRAPVYRLRPEKGYRFLALYENSLAMFGYDFGEKIAQAVERALE